MDEYRTVNVDLAAALVTYGVDLVAVETKDGVTCEFVFPPSTNDVTRRNTSDVAAEWGDQDLLVGARELTANLRRMHFKVREAQNLYVRAKVKNK